MIGFLSGNVIYSTNEEPHETLISTTSGIGYSVFTSNKIDQNKKVNLYVTDITREDGTKLYGFETINEKIMFSELIKINGISGRTAIVILKYRNVGALLNGYNQTFEDIPGIGKKMSVRLETEIAEISKKFSKKILNYSDISNSESIQMNTISNINQEIINKINDSIEAIKSLGIFTGKTRDVLNEILSKNPEFNTEEIVKQFMNISYGNWGFFRGRIW